MSSEQLPPHIKVDGMLLLFHRPTLRRGAATIIENIEAFSSYSRFKTWSVNTEYGFPAGLRQLRFSVIVLHYSLFGVWPYYFDDRFDEYLSTCHSSYKIALFQDEYRYCTERFAFLNRYQIDCVYSLLQPQYFEGTYRKYTRVSRLVSCIPGYVSEELIEAARQFVLPDEKRQIDVGYRARPLDFYMGKGGQEKCAIAVKFQECARSLYLSIYISSEERKRLYGDHWYRFLANCRGVLGVEAGVSVFDVEDVVRPECQRLISENPSITFQEVYNRVLHKWEDHIFYRTVSPRHFEAAAFRVCQILFEGQYSGILKPMVHYIALKKDFSNFQDVMRLFSDPNVRQTLTENAYRDLIASEKYSYRHFIEAFDGELMQVGLKPAAVVDEKRVTALLESGALIRKARAAVWGLRFYGDVLPASLKKPLKAIAQWMLHRRAGVAETGTSK
jgi:hypothetical protein